MCPTSITTIRAPTHILANRSILDSFSISLIFIITFNISNYCLDCNNSKYFLAESYSVTAESIAATVAFTTAF